MKSFFILFFHFMIWLGTWTYIMHHLSPEHLLHGIDIAKKCMLQYFQCLLQWEEPLSGTANHQDQQNIHQTCPKQDFCWNTKATFFSAVFSMGNSIADSATFNHGINASMKKTENCWLCNSCLCANIMKWTFRHTLKQAMKNLFMRYTSTTFAPSVSLINIH